MTVSELIKELSKIPNQNLPIWTEGGYIHIGELLHIQIGKSKDEVCAHCRHYYMYDAKDREHFGFDGVCCGGLQPVPKQKYNRCRGFKWRAE